MLLAQKNHTVGDRRRYTIDYKDFFTAGNKLDTTNPPVITSSSTTATVDTLSYDPSATKVYFFVNGGLLNETFTVSVQVVDILTDILNDTISFVVIGP